MRKHVVIVGGGFGGLSAAKSLRNENVDVTLIDKTNHHLFQPLLYQVATAALAPGDVAQPIRSILRRMKNVRIVYDEVTSIDTTSNRVICKQETVSYDHLILAPGARHSYFGHDDWEHVAPGLKDLDDALAIRDRLLTTFEVADRHVGTPALREYLTFVCVGGGPTGVELAGAIAEISLRTMLPDFPRLRASDIHVILIEAGDRILSSFAPSLSAHALRSLQNLGVDVMLNARVHDITEHGVDLGTMFLPTRNVIWAAGNAASPLLTHLGVPLDRQGRVHVEADCSVPGIPNVFVIGDAAHFTHDLPAPLPGVAQVAMQQGRFVASLLVSQQRAANKQRAASSGSFTYRDYGTMATIGRARAIADVFGIRLKGLVAWIAWAGLHILQLISFRNRLKVMIEWLWYYISFQPGARLLIKRTSKHE